MIQKNWQELIKPNKIEFSSKGKTVTTLVAEPLERGFGLTLGNALRRVLLSSLRGAAVTAATCRSAASARTPTPAPARVRPRRSRARRSN